MIDPVIAQPPDEELPTDIPSDADLMAHYRQPAAPATPAEPAAAAPAPADSPPTAAPATPAAPEPPVEPAPIDPVTQRKPDLANNYRLTAQNAVQQQVFDLLKKDPGLPMPEALTKAHEMLGLPAPFAAAPKTEEADKSVRAPVEPEPAADPVAEIQQQIDALTTQKKGLNKVIDADEVDALNDQILTLREEKVRAEARQMLAEQQQQLQADQMMDAIEAQVRTEFPDLANPQHPMAISYHAELRQLCATASDEVLRQPDLEMKLAAQIADRFQTEFQMPVKRASKPAPAAHAPATPAPTVPQPAPAPAAAAPTAAIRPGSAAAPAVGTPASASPVMGIAPQNPLAEFEALLASDKPLDAAADALLMKARFGTAPAPAGSRFQQVAA